MMTLPSAYAANIVSNVFANDSRYQAFQSYFEAQGMNFIAERAQVAMYTATSAIKADGTTTEPAPDPEPGTDAPALLTIVPSFRAFEPDAPSHEAASIIGVSYGSNSSAILASHVVVGHRPYQILSFSILELDEAGNVVQRTISRERLEGATVEEVAQELGPVFLYQSEETGEPSIIPTPAMGEEDMTNLAAFLFSQFVNDSYASPLYPPGGIDSLLSDTGLVQKWALVQSSRCSTRTISPAGIKKWFLACSSCSSSSNGCTSSSTSAVVVFG
jgi:hypothetical protein